MVNIRTLLDSTSLTELVGNAAGEADLGTFTGTTIPDDSSVKESLQAVETAVETKSMAAALGVTASAANMGTYTGSTIPDNETAKQNIQSLETAVEARPTSGTLAATGGAGLVGFSHGETYAAGTVGKHLQAYVDPKDAPYNCAADGVTDDTTAILTLMATGKPIKWGGPDRIYKVTDTLLTTVRQIWHFDGAAIKMDHSARGYVRPLLDLRDGADYSIITGNGTLDHNSTGVLQAFMTTPVALAYLSAVIVQADYCTISDGMLIKNGWDNNLFVGRLSISGTGTTGDRYAVTVVTGLPIGTQVSNCRAQLSGRGFHDSSRITTPGAFVDGYQGGGFNNGCGTRTQFADLFADECRTGFINDYGAGAGGSFDNCITNASSAATGNEGWGFWIADGPITLTNCQALFGDGDGFVVDTDSGQAILDSCLSYANDKHGFNIGSAKVALSNCTAEGNGQAAANTYDGFLLNSAGETLNQVVLSGCNAYGTQQRYGISATGANPITASILGGWFTGATGAMSLGTYAVAVFGHKVSTANWGAGISDPDFPMEVSGSTTSYLANALGDTGLNGSFSVSDKTTRAKRMAMGYDTTNDVFVMQALQAGVSVKPILLNPSGGDVMAGGSSWSTGHLRLGTYHLWVDSTGDLRIKNGAPTGDADGTVVGTQT